MDARIERLDVAAYTIPTEKPESDGTLEWDATTMVVVHVEAAGKRGFGYTYGDTAAAHMIDERLGGVILGGEAMAIPRLWHEMLHSTRNIGVPGIGSHAMAAVDTALWDLKARLLDVPLVDLFGPARDAIDIYGSGGFTSYSLDELCKQLAGWVEQGIPRVKMKVGRQPNDDVVRVRAAREAIGETAELMVDANGACNRKQAVVLAEAFAEQGVSWFEEPVTSDDLEGLRLLRDRAPAGMEIAAGEYGYRATYFRRMLEAQAVDVLMADATRCGGFSGFLSVAALCDAHQMPVSAHCAPNLHAHVCCSLRPARHIEWFHDHVRIERLLLDGALVPREGKLAPDRSRPGMGVAFKEQDAERFLVWRNGSSLRS